MAVTVIHTPRQNETSSTSRTVVLQSIQKNVQQNNKTVSRMSDEVGTAQTDIGTKTRIANAELSKLQANVDQILTALISLYISIGRASEAALVCKRVLK